MKNFKTYLAESSLSRIMHHVIKTENFGVMSSFRGDNTKEQNLKSYKELITLVRKMGYGFIELKGGYQEESGFVNEKSLFIPKSINLLESNQFIGALILEASFSKILLLHLSGVVRVIF